MEFENYATAKIETEMEKYFERRGDNIVKKQNLQIPYASSIFGVHFNLLHAALLINKGNYDKALDLLSLFYVNRNTNNDGEDSEVWNTIMRNMQNEDIMQQLLRDNIAYIKIKQKSSD